MHNVEKSYYGQALAEDLLDYRSTESRKRLIRCLSEGTAIPFLSLSSCFKPQTDPTYCGISTLVILLNALRIDPQRPCNTKWRWFTEDVLEQSYEKEELEKIKIIGITMEQFQSLAERNGAQCLLVRPENNEKKYEEFLDNLLSVCSGGRINWTCHQQGHNLPKYDEQKDINRSLNDEYPRTFIAVSFYRESLQQNGEGHYSPVAAFDVQTSSVLILDTARYKYPPYWVPVKDLYMSMIPQDSVTGKSRGYFVLERD